MPDQHLHTAESWVDGVVAGGNPHVVITRQPRGEPPPTDPAAPARPSRNLNDSRRAQQSSGAGATGRDRGMDVTMQEPMLDDSFAERGAGVAITSAVFCKWRR